MNGNLSLVVILSVMAMAFVNGAELAELVGRAEKGEAPAQLELGGIYVTGKGVTKDVAEGVKWISKAAEQGNSEAQMKLGGIYIGGRGVLKNSREAAKWYKMSAEQGNPDAQCQIGRMHLTGAGVPKDDVEAYKWSSLAATQGNEAARKVIVFILVRMTPAQIMEGKQRVEEFLALKEAGGPLEMPTEEPSMPTELLPLFPSD